MDDALAHWLALREAADVAARSRALTQLIVASLPPGRAIRAVDLATGTGSNIRYLMHRLERPQQWLAIDRSATLLAHLRHRMTEVGGADIQIETRQANLGTLDDHSLFAGRQLVTASALLDLVSTGWLRDLAAQCRAVGATALFTLSYNGQTSCAPAEPEDALVLDLFNQHQRTDKGLGGAAAGPDAPAAAEVAFAAAGFIVRREPSDWVLGPGLRDMQRLLIGGWAQAATAMSPARASDITAWLARRLAHVDAGRSHITVGHDDLAAIPNR
jgi:hypothetical protein